MTKSLRILIRLFICMKAAGCGSGTSQTPVAAPVISESVRETPETPTAPCAQPIDAPGKVWGRVEAVRALPQDEVVSTCGLAFVDAISEWRSPPVDLLRPIIMHEEADKDALVAWVSKRAAAGKKSAQHAAAMDILGNWRIGDDIAPLAERAATWRPLGKQFGAIETVCSETEDLQTLLASLKEIHELRCMLEVNPLGFAVRCTPIHPAREKIDLTWQEELQDGLFQKVALTKCKESRSCKKLKTTAAVFADKYLAAKKQAEALKTEVFKEQALEWLKLPPFSKGVQ